jgi:NAD(P)-dependent dehydrogenase (short-subunit alcohol dehydrogenase family)
MNPSADRRTHQGFEVVKQLLGQTQPYKIILGARDTKTAQAAFDELKYDNSTHSLAILPVELSNLKTVKSFAQQTLDNLGQGPIDYLVLNAAMARKADDRPGPHGSQWSDSYVVNHLCTS